MKSKKVVNFEDDGAGGNLYDYSLNDIQSDYEMMLRDFGPMDIDVIRYKKVVQYLQCCAEFNLTGTIVS